MLGGTHMTRKTIVPAVVGISLLIGVQAHAQQVSPDDALMTPEGVVAELYDLVTFDPGTSPDWDYAKTLFLPEAVVVLRTGRESTNQLTVDGWVADFERFIEDDNVVETGFIEAIVTTAPWVFKDIAHILVLYEAGFPNNDRRQYGIDAISLVKKDSRWWIAGILNEIPDRDNPIPAELRP